MDDGAVRVLTWNVQGARGLDVARAAAVIGAAAPDVVALQEVQRRQAVALSRALSVRSRRWAFKHWPVVAPAEGLAVLSRHPLLDTASFPLRRRPFWDWRRRIGLDVVVGIGDRRVGLLDVHLSAHDVADRRRHEAVVALGRTGGRDPAPLIVGDLNDLPDAGAHAAFVAEGWIDCWRAVHGDGPPGSGATNWTSGPRVGRPPTQRLDYVLAPPGSTVRQCDVVEPAPLDELATLSDHLPLVATVELPPGPDG
ncbi:MAG: endonuclease/exonuclease/phosphatase family protein [Ilumatobacteraceae bacterium]